MRFRIKIRNFHKGEIPLKIYLAYYPQQIELYSRWIEQRRVGIYSKIKHITKIYH